MTEGVTCGEHWSQHKKDLPNGRHWGAAEVGLPLGKAVMWTAADYYYKPQKRGCDVEPKKWGVGGGVLSTTTIYISISIYLVVVVYVVYT